MKIIIILFFSLILSGCSIFKNDKNYKNIDCMERICSQESMGFKSSKPSYIPQGRTEQLSNQLQWNIQNQNNTHMNNMLKNFPAR